jgi:multidrug efflux pump
MTSFAFILGVVPVIVSRGAGAEMRRTLGTAVFSGMLGVTLFGIVLTPVFFATIDWLSGSRLFAARWLVAAGALGIDVLTLRPLRKATRLMIKELDAPKPPHATREGRRPEPAPEPVEQA